jgi:hypothetical protein
MFFRYLSWIGILFLPLLFACEQGQSTAVLEIYVLDALGNRVEGATVNIYRFREDWEKEQNPIKPPEVSGATGLIRFVNLDEGVYYIDITKSELNNWTGKIETKVQSVGAFFVNTDFIIINNNKASDIANATGKTWLTTGILQAGTLTPIDRVPREFVCRFNNVIVFYKSGRYELRKGDGITCRTSDAPLVGAGTWRFNEAGTIITLKMEGQPDISWSVIESGKNRFVFQDFIITIFGSQAVNLIFAPKE